MRNSKARYLLRLYITGATPRSRQAVEAIRGICEERLQGRYHLEIVDLRDHPELARKEQIIALPLLVRRLPVPLRRLIGNLSDLDRVLHSLDLLPAP